MSLLFYLAFSFVKIDREGANSVTWYDTYSISTRGNSRKAVFDEARLGMEGTMSTGEESARYVPQRGEKSLLLYVTLDLSYNFFEAVIEACPWLAGWRLSQRCT